MWTMNETIQINITIVTCNMLYNYNTKTKTLNKNIDLNNSFAQGRHSSQFKHFKISILCFARRLKIVCNKTELIQAKL